MRKILHVDDNQDWRDRILEFLGPVAEVISCSTLEEAIKRAPEADAFIVDGSIERKNDGIEWAKELQENGKEVLVFSETPPSDVLSVTKSRYIEDREKILVFARQ